MARCNRRRDNVKSLLRAVLPGRKSFGFVAGGLADAAVAGAAEDELVADRASDRFRCCDWCCGGWRRQRGAGSCWRGGCSRGCSRTLVLVTVAGLCADCRGRCHGSTASRRLSCSCDRRCRCAHAATLVRSFRAITGSTRLI